MLGIPGLCLLKVKIVFLDFLLPSLDYLTPHNSQLKTLIRARSPLRKDYFET